MISNQLDDKVSGVGEVTRLFVTECCEQGVDAESILVLGKTG